MNLSFFVARFKSNVGIYYPKGANRSYNICFVMIHLRWITTASWIDASQLQQPRPVNNPD